MLRGINHIVLKVRDLKTADRFYREILGMQRVGERSGMWFYHAGGHPHDLALVEVGPDATQAQKYQTGLFHFCLTVENEQALAELYNRCRLANVPNLGTVDHTVMRSFYISDPDGHVVEIGMDVPREEWDEIANPFAKDRAYNIPDYSS
ncbi:MAG: VOC family protein [Oscillatoria sp. SIO1A7]|nr:VOC family protein [Oscillatoria sp. SIO1A7]